MRVWGTFYGENNKLFLDTAKKFSVYEDTVLCSIPKRLGNRKVCGSLKIERGEDGIVYCLLKNFSPKIKNIDFIHIAAGQYNNIVKLMNPLKMAIISE